MLAAALPFVCLPAPRPALAAETEPAIPLPAPPSLSPSCEAPAADIATPEPLPRVQEKLQARGTIRVLAIGSAATAKTSASSPGYPAQFEEILERTFKGLDVVVINRGVSGEVAAATAERLKTLVALEKPDLVLWQVGTNDALAHVPVEDFAATVRGAVRWLKAHEVDTVLVGLQYALKVSTDPYYKSIRMTLREIATSENVLLVRRYEAMEFIEHVRQGPVVSPDDVPPGDPAHRCMAEHIARAVVVSAFLRGKGVKRGI